MKGKNDEELSPTRFFRSASGHSQRVPCFGRTEGRRGSTASPGEPPWPWGNAWLCVALSVQTGTEDGATSSSSLVFPSNLLMTSGESPLPPRRRPPPHRQGSAAGCPWGCQDGWNTALSPSALVPGRGRGGRAVVLKGRCWRNNGRLHPRSILGRRGPWMPGNVQGQVGRGSEQPGLAEDVPAHCRGVGLDGL